MITVSIATMVEREESLKDTVVSLINQVDKINIYLHGYTYIPDFLKNDKIEVAFDLEYGDHGNGDKFHWIKETKGYHFLCDDDLIYPEDYILNSIKSIDFYNKDVIIGYHGIIPYKLPIASYYTDRIVFHCLEEQLTDEEVLCLGTGTIGYYSEEPLPFNHKVPPYNMEDITFGIFAKEINTKLICLKHNRNWIKHTDKIDLNKTIFSQYINNDYVQTKLINNNPHIFQHSDTKDSNLPLVSIVVIESRLITNRDWVQRCYDSIRSQYYKNIETIIIDNGNRLVSIGKCYNEGVKKSNGRYILFLGDDDYISPDYVYSLVTKLDNTIKYNKDIVGISSYLIMFNEVGENTPVELIPTGMWTKDWLLDIKFKEYLLKYIDSDLFERTDRMNKKIIMVDNQYGYYYRMHEGQISGKKTERKAHQSLNNNSQEINEYLRGIE